ncbi:MAG TPA: patatin-like phospholipase family protein [bacterium]|nr:patatin-like phospholipase family protein [bacterium]
MAKLLVRPKAEKNKKEVRPLVGLALGGGGARGLAHVGVLKVLEEANFQIDYIAGTSIGAVIGAWLALGKSLNELEELCLSFDRSKAWRELVDIGNPRYSFLAGKKIKKFLQKAFGSKTFANCKIPFAVVATDLANGQEIILRRGKLVDAILASVSVPGLLPPVKFGKKYLVDGGPANITPISVVREMGAKLIMASDLSVQPSARFTAKPNLFTTLTLSYTIIREQSIRYQLDQAKSKGLQIVLIKPPFTDIVDTFEFNQTANFIKLGELAMRQKINLVKRGLAKLAKI